MSEIYVVAGVVLFLLSAHLQASPTQRYVYTVKGRVVDIHGKGVSGTDISMKSPLAFEGDIVITETSDADGYFRVRRSSDRPIAQWTLYISDYSSLSKQAHIPLNFHMGTVLSKRCCQVLRGLVIRPRPEVVLNVGNVAVNDKQWPVELELRNAEGGTFAEPSWLTVRDKHGDIISEGGYSRGGSLGLPAGTWNLEIVAQDGPIFRGQETLTVEPTELSKRLTIKIEEVTAPTFDGRAKLSVGKRSEARKRLLALGWKLTNLEFAKRVAAGNHTAIELYLRAGFDPNVFTKNQDTMMTAIFHPFILKSLLEAGADPNRKIRDGITPLLQACGWSIIPKGTIKMLLDSGANIFDKVKDGRDVFALVGDREEILSLLREYQNKKYRKKN